MSIIGCAKSSIILENLLGKTNRTVGLKASLSACLSSFGPTLQLYAESNKKPRLHLSKLFDNSFGPIDKALDKQALDKLPEKIEYLDTDSQAPRHFCNLGAGMSSSTVSERLNQLFPGSTQTVLERDNRIGGKCNTTVKDQRSYDMGAVSGSFGPYNNLYKQVGPKNLKAIPPCDIKDLKSDGTVSSGGLTWVESIKLLPEYYRYRGLWNKYAENGEISPNKEVTNQKGETTTVAEVLSISWKDYCQKNNLETIYKATAVPGFGFGYDNAGPAINQFTYFQPDLMLNTALYGLQKYPKGTQPLVEERFKNSNAEVKTNIEVIQVFGNKEGVVIDYVEGDGMMCREYANALTTTYVPGPNDTQHVFQNLPEALKSAYAKVEYSPYGTALVEASSFSRGKVYYGALSNNMKSSEDGQNPMVLYKPYKESPYLITYQFLNEQGEVDQSKVLDTLKRLGHDDAKIVKTATYTAYNPHFPAKKFAQASEELDIGAKIAQENNLFFTNSLTSRHDTLPHVIKAAEKTAALIKERNLA